MDCQKLFIDTAQVNLGPGQCLGPSFTRIHTFMRFTKRRFYISSCCHCTLCTPCFEFSRAEIEEQTINKNSLHILKYASGSDLDVFDNVARYCIAITVHLYTDFFPGTCVVCINILQLRMNRNIYFSMHWNSLGDAVINVSHLTQSHLHSLIMFFDRWNHVIQIHVLV